MPPTPRLLGIYATPAFSCGDVVTCTRRGDVRIVGLSEASIPWPIGQTLPRGRARALVLYGALAQAVRRKSAEAVAHWWGVGIPADAGQRGAQGEDRGQQTG